MIKLNNNDIKSAAQVDINKNPKFAFESGANHACKWATEIFNQILTIIDGSDDNDTKLSNIKSLIDG